MNERNVSELLIQISKIFELHSNGGPLHIVLGDGNTDDECIRYCLDTCRDHPAVTKNPETAELTVQLVESVGQALLKMDESKRNDVYDQFWRLHFEQQNRNNGLVGRILDHAWKLLGRMLG